MYVFTDGQIRFSQKFVESYNVIQVTAATYPTEYAAGLYTYKGNLQIPANADKISFKYKPDNNNDVIYETDTVYILRDGIDGINGNRGSLWYDGTELTGTGTIHGTAFMTDIYIIGDIYVNTLTYEFYRCITAGTGTDTEWQYMGLVQGPQGEQGKQGPQGPNGAPLNNAGNWTVGTAYKADNERIDIVFYEADGALYTCLQNHTASNSNKPGTAAYWRKFAQIMQTLYFFRVNKDKIYRYDDGTVSDSTITITPYTQLEGSNPTVGIPNTATFQYRLTHKNGIVDSAVNLSKTQATSLTVGNDWMRVEITMTAGTETQTWTVSIDDYRAHYLGAVTALPTVHGKGDWFTWAGATSASLVNGYVYMFNGTGNNYVALDPNNKISGTNLLSNAKQFQQALDDILRTQNAGPGYFSTIFCNSFFANSAAIEALQTKTIVLQEAGGAIMTEDYVENTSGFALLNKDYAPEGGSAIGTPLLDFNGNFHLGGNGTIDGDVNIGGNSRFSGKLNGATGSFTGDFSAGDNIKFEQIAYKIIFVELESSRTQVSNYINNILKSIGKGMFGWRDRSSSFWGMDEILTLDKEYFGKDNLTVKYGNLEFDKLQIFFSMSSFSITAPRYTYKIKLIKNNIVTTLLDVDDGTADTFYDFQSIFIYSENNRYSQRLINDIKGTPEETGYLYSQSGFVCRKEDNENSLILFGKIKAFPNRKFINFLDNFFVMYFSSNDLVNDVSKYLLSIVGNVFSQPLYLPCFGQYGANFFTKVYFSTSIVFYNTSISEAVFQLSYDASQQNVLGNELKFILML